MARSSNPVRSCFFEAWLAEDLFVYEEPRIPPVKVDRMPPANDYLVSAMNDWPLAPGAAVCSEFLEDEPPRSGIPRILLKSNALFAIVPLA